MVAITMGERRSFSKVLFTILLLGGFFATETVFGTPVPDDEAQSDDSKTGMSSKVLKQNESLEVYEGESITIPCHIELDDSKNARVWKFKNGTASEIVLFLDDSLGWTPGASIYNVTKDHSLIINKATPQIVGSYICFVNPEVYTTHDVRLKSLKDHAKDGGNTKDGGTRNYASICLLVTIFMTFLNR